MNSLMPGDWVTQYSAGYWQVIDIKPKYAENDYQSEKASWKKGDLLGQWVILKKAFTPKMRPSIQCECIDLTWCKKVSAEILQGIEYYFSKHPEYLEKYNSAPGYPSPYIINCWLNLPSECVEPFRSMLTDLPQKFTRAQFADRAKDFAEYIVAVPPATHTLNFNRYPWECDAYGEPLLFSPSLEET